MNESVTHDQHSSRSTATCQAVQHYWSLGRAYQYQYQIIWYDTLHCVSKKFPPLKLSQILTDYRSFCTAGKRRKFVKYNNTHLTLGMLLHYLWKLKIHIFCRY